MTVLIMYCVRVKAVDTITVSIPHTSSTTTLVTTISSDGKILVYDLGSLPSNVPEETAEISTISSIGEYDTKGSRLTCLTLADGSEEGSGLLTKKRKRLDDDAHEGSDEGSSDEE
jgi:protein MAK11